MQIVCWFHRFIVLYDAQCAGLKQQCFFLMRAVKEWFYRLRSLPLDWLFDIEVECMLDLIDRGLRAGLIKADARDAAAIFVKASEGLRGAWAAAFQPRREMGLHEYTSCGVEAEFRADKRDGTLCRATTLPQLYQHLRILAARRDEADAARAQSSQFKKSIVLLGEAPAPIKLVFRVCTPRIARLVQQQYTLAVNMKWTVVSENEMQVSSGDTFDDADDLDQRPPPKRTVSVVEAKRIIASLAAVEVRPYRRHEPMCGLRFRARDGADVMHPWRFYGTHLVARAFSGSVIVEDRRLHCRASGGRPCTFARELGA